MTAEERLIWTACREADEQFVKDGATSTKTWIREYFLPSLERHGLKIMTPDQLEAHAREAAEQARRDALVEAVGQVAEVLGKNTRRVIDCLQNMKGGSP